MDVDDDFAFAPSFTPKAAKGPGAFAPSPVREEDEEEEEAMEEEVAAEEMIPEEDVKRDELAADEVKVSAAADAEGDVGPAPPAVDFEAMLAEAMAAAEGGDVNALLSGPSSKMMNSPAAKRVTETRPAPEPEIVEPESEARPEAEPESETEASPAVAAPAQVESSPSPSPRPHRRWTTSSSESFRRRWKRPRRAADWAPSAEGCRTPLPGRSRRRRRRWW